MPTMVPDRGENPKRKVTWDVHSTATGAYQYSVRGGQTAPKKHTGMNLEVSREGHSAYSVPSSRKYKR